MNSKQRRKDKRIWKYSVKIPYKDYDHYEEIWEWLKSHYGTNANRCGWRDRHNYYLGVALDNVEWQFQEQKKYVEFMLRWS